MARNKKHWTVVSSKEIYKTGFFRFRSLELELPDKRIMPHYYVLDFTDWVNVIALTKDNEMILIRQYRPPVEEETLEIPGGAVNAHLTESLEDAARRELKEETGYEAKEMRLLGFHRPNPALQGNKLWTYLALDCEKTSGQELDEYEDIDVLTAPIEQALAFTRDGQINHSLVLTAFYLAMPYFESINLKK